MSEMSESWTTLKLIRWTEDFFKKKEIPNPRLDAELLLAHALKCKRIDLYAGHEKKVSEKELTTFRALIERRATREPLQYIVGETEFWGLTIKVTPAVLIPRPETELLVEEALRLIIDDSERRKVPFRSERSDNAGTDGGHGGRTPCLPAGRVSPPAIIDIGTGSGCIAIALAKQLPKADLLATEHSREAAEVANENISQHQLSDRVKILLADIAPWNIFKTEGRSFDLIVSNPPYIPTEEFPTLQPEVRDFEPRKALDGGPDGLSVVRQILDEAPPFLKSGGSLLMEIGEGQAPLLKTELAKDVSWESVSIRKDYSGIERILVLKKRGSPSK